MLTWLAIVIVALGLGLRPAYSATIELTGRSVDGHTLGVGIEGKIEHGDAEKLLKTYEYFGPAATAKVFFWSLGGDVEEAIKIGKLIRQLRLSTYAPDRLNTLGFFEPEAIPIDKANNICASACVLAFAGGVTRAGDLLILHRPFVINEGNDRISDLEYEKAEINAINLARDYLRAMEFPDYYIDKMIGTSSQDGYIPTARDLEEHPIPAITPSIEEIILSKCQSLNAVEQQELDEYYLAQAANSALAAKVKKKTKEVPVDNKLQAKSNAYSKCESEQLVELQLAAWNRLAEARVSGMCSQAEGSETADCRKRVLKQLTDDALARGSRAKPGDTAPSEFSVDMSIFSDQEADKNNRNDTSNWSDWLLRLVPSLFLAFIILGITSLFLSSLAIWRKTRGAAGFSLSIASCVFGIITWFVGAIVTFTAFGWPGLLIGFFVLGIGVVPIGIFAALFALHINGLAVWLCAMTLIALGSRSAGVACLASAERYNREKREKRVAQAAQAALEQEFGRS